MRISFGNSRGSAGRDAKDSVGSKVGLTLFGMVFGSIGLFIMIMTVMGGLQTRAMQSWVSAPCVVEHIEVNSSGDGYRLNIRYNYSYDGSEYKSEKFGAGSTFDDVATKQRMLKTYAKGSTHSCYVNPTDPTKVVLHRGSGSIFLILGPVAFCSIFVFIGYGMVLFAWLPKRKKSVTATASKPATSGAGMQIKVKIGVILFCTIFIVVGLVVTNFTFVKPYRLQKAAKSWMTVDAVVLDSTVRSHSSDDGTTYSVYIAYKYRCNEETYHGDRYSFTGGSSSGRGAKQSVVRKYPKGKKFKLYIDPDDVRESVILRDVGKKLYIWLFPLIFTFVGGFMLIAVLNGSMPGNRSGRYSRTARKKRGKLFDASSLETFFKPASGHAKRIFGAVLAALFWNGIISVFIVQIVKDWQRGAKPIGSTLFISIFVAVGIGIIAAVVFNVLRVFNPTIKIQNASCILFPGAEEDISFEISGNIARLQSFTVTLAGEEQATYRRGTDTVTDTDEFYNSTLYKAEDFNISRRDEFKLSIPKAAMHSFKSSNNKIVWKLKVHGDVPRWPDVSEDYILNVNPKELC